MENPSLNLYLLCLAPKYLDLILWALSFGLNWRVDVHERASRRNISENVQFPAKIQHAPKSRTKSKTVKFGCQVV